MEKECPTCGDYVESLCPKCGDCDDCCICPRKDKSNDDFDDDYED